MASVLTLPVSSDFQLARAVCTYGYYRLAPNHWEGDAGRLIRPLRDAAGRSMTVRITQSHAQRKLTIRCDCKLGADDRTAVKQQVRRMLRTDEDMRPWRRMHKPAARAGFGRLFRSPTLFEDIVKTITSCNISWAGTQTMNRRLVEQLGGGDFPTPGQFAAMQPRKLQTMCRVGYRAPRLIKLARQICDGTLDLAWFESEQRQSDELFEALLRIDGVGPYAAGNILQHLGHYDRLPVDSELVRHLKESRGVEGSLTEVTRRAHEVYDRYAPYQFLAYWFELWHGYRETGVL